MTDDESDFAQGSVVARAGGMSGNTREWEAYVTVEPFAAWAERHDDGTGELEPLRAVLGLAEDGSDDETPIATLRMPFFELDPAGAAVQIDGRDTHVWAVPPGVTVGSRWCVLQAVEALRNWLAESTPAADG